MLDTFQKRCLSNHELYRSTGLTPVSKEVRSTRWRWIDRELLDDATSYSLPRRLSLGSSHNLLTNEHSMGGKLGDEPKQRLRRANRIRTPERNKWLSEKCGKTQDNLAPVVQRPDNFIRWIRHYSGSKIYFTLNVVQGFGTLPNLTVVGVCIFACTRGNTEIFAQIETVG